jgi:BirA family biotin operon repressor/biotin-[acetyl-CoA-carboxylase] ligase
MIETDAPVAYFDDIDSTIVEARRRAERGETGPLWIIAKRQSAGRGRRGRAWVSLEGNLFATYLAATTRRPQEVALIGFAAGVAIAEALEAHLGAGRVTLKWPNDVMIDAAKASGLMIDSGALGPGRLWFALGFGVNIVGAPGGLDQDTACLARAMPPGAAAPSPLTLFGAIRPRLEAHAEALARDGFAALRQAWLAWAHCLGDSARVQVGAETIEGRIMGLSPHGELELETATGLRAIAAGDILMPAIVAA